MSRKIVFRIDDKPVGKTVKDFLKSHGFSHGIVSVLKSYDEGIMVNGNRVFTDYVLKNNDELVLNIIEKSTNSHLPAYDYEMDIVYEDEDILIINKPYGMPIHPSRLNYMETLANAITSYLIKKGIDPVFHCINRLDKDTSGLTIIAKNMYAAGLLSEMVKKREIHREYIAIVEGTFTDKRGRIDQPILKIGTSMKRIVDEAGERAVTNYEVLAENNNLSIVRLILETGKTHQIRVHMLHVGHPLIGDQLYNPDNKIMNRQALHASRLSFIHPVTNEKIDVISELPTDMQKVISDYELFK